MIDLIVEMYLFGAACMQVCSLGTSATTPLTRFFITFNIILMKWKYAEKMTHDLIDVKVVKVNFNGTAIMEHLTVIVYFLLKPVG